MSFGLLAEWRMMAMRIVAALGQVLFGVLLALSQPVSAQERVANPVVPNATLGPFRHGTYPSLESKGQKWTHIGVDLVAQEGSPVYPFGDGTVVSAITENDPEFSWAGNAVMIEHATTPTKMFTIYLHLRDTPNVKVGGSVQGGKTEIGKVGRTGHANNVAHVHFEIRRFKEWLSRWGNIYAPGDQRESSYLKSNWEDPVPYFARFPVGMRLVAEGAVSAGSPEGSADRISCPPGTELAREEKRVGEGFLRIEQCQKHEGGRYILHGPRVVWLNGCKNAEEYHKNGKLHGKVTGWIPWRDCVKSYEAEFREGELHGRWTTWYTNGQKKEEGDYRNRARHGLWIHWNEEGQKLGEVQYRDGVQIASTIKLIGTYRPHTALILGSEADYQLEIRDDGSWSSRGPIRALSGRYRKSGNQLELCTPSGFCNIFDVDLPYLSPSKGLEGGFITQGIERWRKVSR